MESVQCLYKPKDYASDQEVKWCPGCGDYAIINSVQKAFSDLNLKKEDVTIVSGIGCSSRFPYYMDTYGFHTIHGRAAAVATGVKLANPNLSVWMVSGDGDSLAIGGNHFIHLVRRNINLNLLLFNNEIYGLTKGQHSPTTKIGHITKSAPFGTIENPFSVGELVIGAQGQFYARVPDTDIKLMTKVFVEAEKHVGTSVVEILQNCVIFNDATHEAITSKESRINNQIVLEHGKPMLFGENNSKGLILNGAELKVVKIGENGITENDILVHDTNQKSNIIHQMLIQMKLPDFPVALGVIRNVDSKCYDSEFHSQIFESKTNSKYKSVDQLFLSGSTFQVN